MDYNDMTCCQNFMKQALTIALEGSYKGEVPVGAVLVKNNEIIGRGHNRVIELNDPTAHAEIVAIREGAAVLGNYRLLDSTLYVTVEPCIMCAGAVLQARIKRLVFGAEDPKGGAFGSLYNMAEDDRLNHRIDIVSGVSGSECRSLLQEFFRRKRIEERYRSGRNGVDSKST
ncbi:MAG: tRNA adenosine(34) deaminase TadA [Pseudomonadota bacterium]